MKKILSEFVTKSMFFKYIFFKVEKEQMRKVITLVASMILLITIFSACKGNDGDLTYEITFVQSGYPNIIRNLRKEQTLANEDIPIPKQREGYTTTWEITDFSKIKINTIVKASEVANNYTINYDVGCNDAEISSALQNVTFNAEYELCKPTRPGYFFDGWIITDTEIELKDGVYDIASDICLIARWREDEDYWWTGFY